MKVNAIEGFALADCPAIVGDSIATNVKWNSDTIFTALAGKPVRLLVELKDADLYSLQFTN